MNRHTAREKAMQILYQLDLTEASLPDVIENFLEHKERDPFLISIVEGVTKHLPEIDHMISQHLENWKLDRLGSVEKSIMRMATFEIKYRDDIPESVSINEAIELAKTFGDEKSGNFVNGVLSKIIQTKES